MYKILVNLSPAWSVRLRGCPAAVALSMGYSAVKSSHLRFSGRSRSKLVPGTRCSSAIEAWRHSGWQLVSESRLSRKQGTQVQYQDFRDSRKKSPDVFCVFDKATSRFKTPKMFSSFLFFLYMEKTNKQSTVVAGDVCKRNPLELIITFIKFLSLRMRCTKSPCIYRRHCLKATPGSLGPATVIWWS